MIAQVGAARLEELEVDLLLEGLNRLYGLDFRDYSSASVQRQVLDCMRSGGLATVSALQERVLRDPVWLDRLLTNLAVEHTYLYRDPEFYRAFRRQVIPLLRDRERIWIWHAGCATGEEVYSLAILFDEEGLGDRCRFFGTDLSVPALAQARRATYSHAALQAAEPRYRSAGGRSSLSSYFQWAGADGVACESLRQNTAFFTHNLVSDGSLREFDVVLCRYVLIYFNRTLQERVHDLFLESTGPGSILCLGMDEWLGPCRHEARFQPICRRSKIFRRAD